ncbi:MAG: hypothetical protein HYX51_01240 [Chloroflexi bacterium]|nr:hypothetical protein [Chloroflexota bacterium]
MSVAALPYATFLLFLEFAAGCQIVLLLPQFRGREQVSPGFLKMGAVLALSVALLALWVSFALPAGDEISGYRLDDRFAGPMRAAVLVYCLLCGIVNWFNWRNQIDRGRWSNVVASVAAFVAIVLAAAVVRLPTWGFAGALLSLTAGAASLGAVSLGMTLGHWYLVTPRLPERPLNELTFLLLVIIAVQSVLVLINVLLPVNELPVSADATQVSLGANIWFWLRVGVGLLFPLALAFMAWQSSVVRAMMSATGLLYLAMGAVLAGEVLARALLFSTARPL